MANRPGPIFVSRTNGLHQPESHAPADAARVAALVDELRRGLAHRGATGIRDLGRTFKIVDRDGSGSLDTEEFTRAVRMCKLQIEPEEVKLIFDHFDTRRDGRVDFEEFLRAVRGTMAPVRRSLVVQVFHALDSMGDGNGVLDVNDFTNIFDARSAPEVQAGRRSEADVLREFVEGFEGTRGNRDGTVTMDEWLAYYDEVSASIDNDDHFGALVERTWSSLKTLDESGREVSVIKYTPQRNVDILEGILRKKVWEKTTRSKNETRVLESLFRHFDADGSKTISSLEFQQAMERFGLYAPPDEIQALFDRYDVDGSGCIRFQEFSAVLTKAPASASLDGQGAGASSHFGPSAAPHAAPPAGGVAGTGVRPMSPTRAGHFAAPAVDARRHLHSSVQLGHDGGSAPPPAAQPRPGTADSRWQGIRTTLQQSPPRQMGQLSPRGAFGRVPPTAASRAADVPGQSAYTPRSPRSAAGGGVPQPRFGFGPAAPTAAFTLGPAPGTAAGHTPAAQPVLGSAASPRASIAPQQPQQGTWQSTLTQPGVAEKHTRVRSLANPERRTLREDPEYFKKSSKIFG